MSVCGSYQKSCGEKASYFSGGSRISRWGGAEPLEGGADLRRGCFSAKTYAKMKELDPVGGGGRPPDPPMYLHNKKNAFIEND